MPRDSTPCELATTVAETPFARRAEPQELAEWMDEPCSYEDFRDCLLDLRQVNRLLSGYAPTLKFLDRVMERHPQCRRLRVLDVGFGGGDMLRQVARWAARRGLQVELTGVDLNPHAARAAREFSQQEAGQGFNAIKWIATDVFSYRPEREPDVILSSLFTHHLATPQVVEFVRWMERHAQLGWFVNDLRRSERAARWYRPLAALMRWHRFVRHDGVVSIRRAFREQDWIEILAAAGVGSGDAAMESHTGARLCVARVR